MNNKPYFENVYIYGDLYLDKVLLEYDFFSYSILKDNKDKFFVCYCYEVEKRQSWLINEIELNNLISFLLNEIDIKNAFLLGDNKKIIITKDYDSGKEKSMPISKGKIINMDILPDENEFLDKIEESNKYIKILYDKLFETKIIYNNIIKNISLYYIKKTKTISDTKKQLYNPNIKYKFIDFLNDDFTKNRKKIKNSDIANSGSIILGENNDINLSKPVIAASLTGAFISLYFNNISKPQIKEDKNYAKAT